MAIDTISSGMFSGYIDEQMSAPIFEQALKSSVAMQIFPQIPLGPEGKKIPIFTGTPQAEWVGEAAAKPLTDGSVSLKHTAMGKIAAIFVVSAEVVRANPGGYMQNMQAKLGESFALAFDNAVLHGLNSAGTAAGPFADCIDDSTLAVELDTPTAYDNLVGAMSALNGSQNGKYKLRTWALDSSVEPTLLMAKDTTGRPLFAESTYTETSPTLRQGRLLGRPVVLADTIRHGAPATAGTVVGYAGDFSQAAWGVVSGISYDVTDQATLPIGTSGAMVSLWQNNLVAVRAEAEYGWVLNDAQAFVKITDATADPS